MMFGFISNVIDVARVFGHVSKRIFEITKNIVSGTMTAGPPRRLDAVSSQIRDPSHHFINTRNQVCHMVYRWVRRCTEGNVVMLRIGTQENHLLSTPIRDSEAKDTRVEVRNAFEVRGIVHDMTYGPRLNILLFP